MSQLPTAEQVRNAVLLHENTTPSQLSPPPMNNGTVIGTSGYSVGVTQFDFGKHVNDGTPAQFEQLLTNTATITNLTAVQIDDIVQGITVSGTTSNAVTQYLPQINQALSTAQGWAFITSEDANDLSVDTSTVENLIAAANQKLNGAGVLSYGNLNSTAVAELSAYVNQFGSNVQQLTSFLQGGPAILGDPNSQQASYSNGTLSLQDLNDNFFAKLWQFSKDPNAIRQYNNFLSSAQQAGSLSSSGQTIDDESAESLQVYQTANGGAISTEAAGTDSLGDAIYDFDELDPNTMSGVSDISASVQIIQIAGINPTTNIAITSGGNTQNLTLAGTPGVEDEMDADNNAVLIGQAGQPPSLAVIIPTNGTASPSGGASTGGVVSNGATTSVLDASQIGSALGSTIGNLLAGGNALEAIPLSTALSLTLGAFGTIIQQSNGGNVAPLVDGIVQNLPQEALGAGAGAIASFLTAEILNAAGVKGFAAQAINTVSSLTIGRIASNLAQGEDAFTGLENEDGSLNLANFEVDPGNWTGS